jgi:nucleotide-binding universal stress UspA family protein
VSRREGAAELTTFSHILVDVDARAEEHPALAQAADLAGRCGARLTVVDIVEDVPTAARAYLSERLEADILQRRREALAVAVASVERLHVPVTTAVLRGRPATAIVRHAIDVHADLVVRSHARDTSSARALFGSVDMQLLRKCPCPVWLVGVGERARPRRILAAVHPDRDDPVEQALNLRIVAAARTMATLERGTLTVLTAWAPYGERLLRSHMSPVDAGGFVKAAKASARAAFDELLGQIGDLGPRTSVVFVKGQPGDVIPRYARRHDIDLVVMGTVARRGLAGLLMGNTAEHLIQRLQCSLFALKPEGFRSPVEA